MSHKMVLFYNAKKLLPPECHSQARIDCEWMDKDQKLNISSSIRINIVSRLGSYASIFSLILKLREVPDS
jgi:hypothetical protein